MGSQRSPLLETLEALGTEVLVGQGDLGVLHEVLGQQVSGRKVILAVLAVELSLGVLLYLSHELLHVVVVMVAALILRELIVTLIVAFVVPIFSTVCLLLLKGTVGSSVHYVGSQHILIDALYEPHSTLRALVDIVLMLIESTVTLEEVAHHSLHSLVGEITL
jgi:hypothetical protein